MTKAEELQKAINESANHLRVLWVGYVVFGTYLILTSLTVTHKQLFLESPLTLPILEFELSLKNFFIAAPIIFFALHVYFRLHLHIFINNIKKFKKENPKKILYDLFDPLIFLQNEISDRGIKNQNSLISGINLFLKFICEISEKFFPIIVTVCLWCAIMPYQDESISKVYRIIILFFCLMVFKSNLDFILRLIFLILFSTFIFSNFHPFILKIEDEILIDRQNYHEIKDREGRHTTPLYLAEMINKVRGRDFSDASFKRSDMRRRDFTGAILSNTNFEESVLEGSRFTDVKQESDTPPVFKNADLEYADLANADLKNADFTGADLRTTSFIAADLKNAKMVGTNLESSDLTYADITGVDFDDHILENGAFSEAFSDEFDTATIKRTKIIRVRVWNTKGVPKSIPEKCNVIKAKPAPESELWKRIHHAKITKNDPAWFDNIETGNNDVWLKCSTTDNTVNDIDTVKASHFFSKKNTEGFFCVYPEKGYFFTDEFNFKISDLESKNCSVDESKNNISKEEICYFYNLVSGSHCAVTFEGKQRIKPTK